MKRRASLLALLLLALVGGAAALAQSTRFPNTGHIGTTSVNPASSGAIYIDAAVCNGTVDATATLQAAANAIKVSGGRNNRGGKIVLPKGECKLSASLDMKGTYGIEIAGQGGVAPGSPKPSTVIRYTGTGAASSIAANGAIGASFEDLSIVYDSSSFTGTVLDFSQGTQPSGCAMVRVKNVTIGTDWNDNLNAFGASALVNFDNCINSEIRDSNLQGAYVGIRLRNSNTHFSNSITVDNVRFSDFRTAAIVNGSQRLSVVNSTFENNPFMISWNTTHPGAYPTMAPAYAVESAMATQGFTFVGNYVGDGDYSTPFFDTRSNDVHGLLFAGNFFAGNISLGNLAGAELAGNSFNTVGITFAAGGTYDGVRIADNGTVGAVTFTNYPTAGVTRVGNRNIAGTNNVADSIGATALYATGRGIDAATAGDTLPVGASNAGAITIGGRAGSFTQILGTAPALIAGNAVATSGGPTINGGKFQSRGSYWNGSAAVNYDAYWQTLVDTATPSGRLSGFVAGTEIARLSSGGTLFAMQGTLSAGGGGTGTVSAATVTPGGSSNMAICTTNCTGWSVTGPLQTGLPAKANNTIASAATIAPTAYLSHVTGTTTIATITPPASFAAANSGGCMVLIFDGVAPWSAAGNITVAGTPTTAGTNVMFCYDPVPAKWAPSRVL